jgi:putative transposase
VRFRFVAAEKAQFPVALLCRCLAVSRPGFYAWQRRPPSARVHADRRLAVDVKAAHAESGHIYGSPRVHRELRAQGRSVSRKRVARVMREQGLRGRQRRRFVRTTDSHHALPVAPNVVNQAFDAAAPNTLWAGDITYVATHDGWLYLAVLLDLDSRRVIGYAMGAHLTRTLVLDTLRAALTRRPNHSGVTHHSDRGCQYASHEYRSLLAVEGLVCSMSRAGNCWDNAVVESFFATLKTELPQREWSSRAAATAAITDYIDAFYNPRRRHSSLDYLSPVEFELRGARQRATA